jgi:hypothetical protein
MKLPKWPDSSRVRVALPRANLLLAAAFCLQAHVHHPRLNAMNI